jgi:hypothetical protein
MRKLIAIALILMLASPTAFAATENIAQGMGQKAIRGAVNLVTGIVEVPVQIYKGYNKGFKFIENEGGSKAVGTILGFFRGLGHAGGRMSWGALELFGFWAANSADNEGVGVPLDAEYAWEMGEQYSIFEPSFGEGVKPIGRKLLRGVGNAVGGILEVPGQTMKGVSDGNGLEGFGRGLWFWFSREVYGMGEIYSCIVPNPVDNPGYAFNGEWPWSAMSE